MKKTQKIIISIVLTLTLIFGFSLIINILLNKKYVVDEILFAKGKNQLEGIHELISYDYIGMIYFTLFSLIVIMVFGIILLSKK